MPILVGQNDAPESKWLDTQTKQSRRAGTQLDEYPEEEAEELALIYAARGMNLDEARAVAHKMLADPEHALDVLAREELGLNPDDLGSAWARWCRCYPS